MIIPTLLLFIFKRVFADLFYFYLFSKDHIWPLKKPLNGLIHHGIVKIATFLLPMLVLTNLRFIMNIAFLEYVGLP